MNRIFPALLVTLGILAFILPSTASVPTMISYQGKLTDAAGNPLNGTYNLSFAIYNDATAGSLLWTETQNGVQVSQGLFNVLLGSVNPLPDSAFTGLTWLQTSVEGNILTPRVRIVSAGYALRSKKAEEVTPPLILSGAIDSPNSLISATNSGTGAAGSFRSDGGYGLVVTTTAKSGACAYFGVDNATSSATSLQAANVALGKAGDFSIYNSSNSSPAIYAYTNGLGPALRAQATGSGFAGELLGSAYVTGNLGVGTSNPTSRLDIAGTAQMTGFKLTTGATNGYVLKCDGMGNGTWQADGLNLPFSTIFSSSSTLFWLRNSGTGGVIYANSQGAGDAIYALSSGTGSAGSFSINSASNSNALFASTNGSGHAVSAINTGTGNAGNFQINNTSSSSNALYVTTNGSGDAIYAFSASGRAGYFNGDVYVAGDLTFPTGKPSVPIAYGIVNSDGTLQAGTSGVSSTWDSANQEYRITIPGGYSTLTHVAVANVVGLTGPRFAMVSSVSSKLVVTIFNLSGVKSQGIFNFVVYKP
ncbi:MAG: hypothetical protein QHH26_10340 [Armatimonadota bacterium]|nr:hypothetical protein [Armatimonadota bacterium]